MGAAGAAILMMCLMLVATAAAVFNQSFQIQSYNFRSISGATSYNFYSAIIQYVYCPTTDTTCKHY